MIQPVNRSPSKFSMRHIPFSDDPPNAAEFYAALGKAVCLWGRLENQIAFALVSLQKFPETQNVRERLPRPWSAKVELWRKLFGGVPYFSEKRAAALGFIDHTKEAAKDRHLLQHSHWYGFENDKPLTANFRSIEQVRDKIGVYQCPVTLEQLQHLVTHIEWLLSELWPIMTWIADLQTVHPEVSEGPPEA
jgi:hypothetical protein